MTGIAKGITDDIVPVECNKAARIHVELFHPLMVVVRYMEAFDVFTG